MTPPTCSTCKFWGRSYSGACDKVDAIATPDDKRFELALSADDDQGLDGILLTGPNFGCVLHEARS